MIKKSGCRKEVLVKLEMAKLAEKLGILVLGSRCDEARDGEAGGEAGICRRSVMRS